MRNFMMLLHAETLKVGLSTLGPAPHNQLLELRLPRSGFLNPRGDLAMADNLKDRGAQDRARINVNEEHEVRYWTKKFGVSEDELKKAVESAGVSADAVAKKLGKPA
jgi:hypothetical protein